MGRTRYHGFMPHAHVQDIAVWVRNHGVQERGARLAAKYKAQLAAVKKTNKQTRISFETRHGKCKAMEPRKWSLCPSCNV